MLAKRLLIHISIALTVLFTTGLYTSGSATSLFREVDVLLQQRLEIAEKKQTLSVGSANIRHLGQLSEFYQDRNYAPAWTDDFGLLPHTKYLIMAIKNARQEGLRPVDFWVPQISRILKIARQKKEKRDILQAPTLVHLEFLLTDAFLTYGSQLLYGKLDPNRFQPDWQVEAPDVDLTRTLQNALNQGRFGSVLRNLGPKGSGYLSLKNALAQYRRMARNGGWPEVPHGPSLKEGTRSPRVPALRKRLAVTGDFIVKTGNEFPEADDDFDADLKQGVIAFQKRLGLPRDGIAGPSTLAALRIPVEDQIRRIEVNLERMRWLPRKFENQYLLVNITDYQLRALDNGNTVFNMRVIVGKPHRPTPILNDHLTAVVFNPNWYVPPTIFREDILPKVREKPDYLKELNMRVLQVQDNETWELDPSTIDWQNPWDKSPPLQIRQDPGPGNFLGRFKFILSNQLDIYLHDTSSKYQFNGSIRDLSSGCVRLEEPQLLANYLLKEESDWDEEKTMAALTAGAPRKVNLTNPYPVYIVYWTTWTDEDDLLQFRPDIYELDGPVIEALTLSPR